MKVSTWVCNAGLGMVVAAAVLTGTWMYLLAGLAGLMFVAFIFTRPRWGLLLWLLLAPVANTYANMPLPVGIPDISFGRVTISVIIVALLLQARLSNRRLAPWGGVELAAAALLCIMALDQLVRSGDQFSASLRNFDTRVAPFLILLAARNFLGSRDDLKYVGYIIAAFGGYLALHGIFQYLTYSPMAYSGFDREIVADMGHQVAGRAVGPFVNSVEYGAVAAIAFAATVVVMLHLGRGVTRFVLLTALAVLGVSIVLSATRAVWFGWYLSLVAMAVLDRKGRTVLLTSVGAATIIAIALALTLSETSFLRQRTVEAGGVSSRLEMYQVAARMAIRQPLLGYGSGAPSRVAARSELQAMGGIDADLAAGQFHNIYIMTLMEWGIIGLIASLAMNFLLVKAAFDLRRVARNDPAYHFAGLFLATTVIYMVQGLFADTPPFLYLTGLYFFLGGLVLAQLDRVTAFRPQREKAGNAVYVWRKSMVASPSGGNATGT